MGSLISEKASCLQKVFGYWDHWEKAECKGLVGFDGLCLQRQLGQVQHGHVLEQLQNFSRTGNILISFRKQNKVAIKTLG